MKAQLLTRLQPLREQVQANPRLQGGLALIALTLLVYLVLVLGDWRDAKLAALQEARQRLEQVEQLAGQQEWPERAAEATRLAESLWGEIPEAASAGLAQADFQGWLREMVDVQQGNVRLDVEPPVVLDQPPGMLRVSATLSGGLPPSQVLQMIHRIESRTNLATIPVLTIRSDGLNQTFSLTVQGYYRLTPGQAAP